MIRLIMTALFTISGLFLINSCNTQETRVKEETPTPLIETFPDNKNWDKEDANEFLIISELKKKNPKEGIYETAGYMVGSVPECVCPPGYDCDCAAPSITISERNQKANPDELGDSEIRILTNPKEFKQDQKYRFKVSIPEWESASDPLNEVLLVAYRQERNSSVNGREKADSTETTTIREISGRMTKPGIYRVAGFVTKIYQCPPCPPRQKCAPCRRANSIVAAEKNESSENIDPGENEIIILTDKPETFEKGKKYLFRIEIKNEKLPNDPEFNVINLVSYKRIEN
jgi:hypothetical protein